MPAFVYMKCPADPFIACTNMDCTNGGCVRQRPPAWTFTPVQRGCICPPTSEQTCMNPDCGRKPVIKPDMIPDEVVESTAWAMCDDINGEGAWDETPFRHRPMWRSAARAAIAAALNAWPGMLVEWHSRGPGIILPLPQEENPDE